MLVLCYYLVILRLTPNSSLFCSIMTMVQFVSPRLSIPSAAMLLLKEYPLASVSLSERSVVVLEPDFSIQFVVTS